MPGGSLLTLIKLSSIFGCLIYARLVFPKDCPLHLALLLTLIADLLIVANLSLATPLILIGDCGLMELGIVFFFGVQTVHCYRLTSGKLIKPLIIYAVVALGLALVNLWLRFCPTIIILCGFYAVLLIANIVISACWVSQEPHNLVAKFALFGFILFISCDICTAVSYLGTNGVFTSNVITPANFLAWFFYYPAQIFLSNSSKCVKIESKQEIVL